MNEIRSAVCSREVSRQFALLILIVFVGLVLSIEFDRGAFFVWQDPLSDLGALTTVNGTLNVLPRTIFDLTMAVSGLLMLRVSSLFSADAFLRHGGFKKVMTFICSIGFFMVLMPYDVNLTVHEIGASLVFGMLWGMTVLFSAELEQASFRTRSVLSQLVLQGTVLPYAFMFAAGIPAEVAAQKIAVLGLMFSFWYTTRSGESRHLLAATVRRY